MFLEMKCLKLDDVERTELKPGTGLPPRPSVFSMTVEYLLFAKDFINFPLAQNCPSYPDKEGPGGMVVVTILLFSLNVLDLLPSNTPNS